MYDPEKPSVAREEDFAARAPAPVSADEAEFAGAARVQAIADFDGLSVTYSYPEPISVASGADRVRLNLGKISAEVDVTAHAVPRLDSTAFLVAEFNNDTGEILLPSNEASFYLDGKYVGRQKLELIANGASADLSFGPIEGLRLEHVVLNRNEGDRGVISKSNEFTEATQLKIENLTDEAWPIRLIGQIPYSEQEDLEISWKTSVEPSDTRVHDKQGIIAWEFELGANDTRDIALSYKIEWPDGMELR